MRKAGDESGANRVRNLHEYTEATRSAGSKRYKQRAFMVNRYGTGGSLDFRQRATRCRKDDVWIQTHQFGGIDPHSAGISTRPTVIGVPSENHIRA
jgi:hypothetical protein